MHASLGATMTPALPPGVELVEVDTSQQPAPFISTMVEGFGMPQPAAWPSSPACCSRSTTRTCST